MQLQRQDSNVLNFNFDGEAVRVVMRDGEPWFVAADICRELAIADHNSSLRLLSDSEKGLHSMPTPGGEQLIAVISESGMYRLLFKSRKVEAERFQQWVTGDVLPSIRKTGGYGIPALTDPLELIIHSARALQEQRGRLDSLEHWRDTVEARLVPSGSTKFYSIRGWASLQKHRVAMSQAKALGKRATALCAQRGITPGNTPDEHHGLVNTYPVEILREAFSDYGYAD